MKNIGYYRQTTEFTNENAGTSEWCLAERNGKKYFIKKFLSPIYPPADLELPKKMQQNRIARFHSAMSQRGDLYKALQKANTFGVLLVPIEVLPFELHLCAIAENYCGDISPDKVYLLPPWQRLVLMRTLTLGLSCVHKAGYVHSDVKPDNLLIHKNAATGACHLRLIDFDSCFSAEEPPKSPEDILGDPAYFPPEVYCPAEREAFSVGKQMDMFALGLVLHYLWCGALPNKPENKTIGEFILDGGAVELDNTLPLALSLLIRQLLALQAENRLDCEKALIVLTAQVEEAAKRTGGTAEKCDDRFKALMSKCNIVCHDSDMRVLLRTSIDYRLQPNMRDWIKAPTVDGYQPAKKRVELCFDRDGRIPGNEIRILYRKARRSGARLLVRVIISLCLLYAFAILLGALLYN